MCCRHSICLLVSICLSGHHVNPFPSGSSGNSSNIHTWRASNIHIVSCVNCYVQRNRSNYEFLLTPNCIINYHNNLHLFWTSTETVSLLYVGCSWIDLSSRDPFGPVCFSGLFESFLGTIFGIHISSVDWI